MNEYNPIAESKNYIVLEKYERQDKTATQFQSEAELENEFIQDLVNQGYEYLPKLNNPSAMLANVRKQIQDLNETPFSNNEWKRFVKEYLDRPGDNIVDKTRNVHDNYICDFTFDDGKLKNIYLFDKKRIIRNKLQVIKQFEQTGTYKNRYDVTILVNGLPLVQIELKKRGVSIREAFNQIHRYSKESFNSENSLYKYLQIFVISNGTDTRYFANTTKRNKNNFDFTMHWAKADNKLIKDLKDFTPTFLQKNTLLQVLLHYSVFDVENTLMVMRPYQIAATERMLWKIRSSYNAKIFSKPDSGGYIWHTTGSGKTLTSFKAARLATELDFIDKVLFVVDRKDLDTQTMNEYQKFSPDSVNGTNSTLELKRNLAQNDNKIIVTTIQKLNHLMKSEKNLAAYHQQVVFIFDECHRSQFGEAQKNLKKKFKRYYQFGFTGTPIFPENASGADTTAKVFGHELHSYVITDAIRDEKVLKFKVDYNDVRPKFKEFEDLLDEKQLTAAENKEALQHPVRINEISQYILKNYHRKTHRLYKSSKGFNAMFAVNSIEAAKLYYETLNNLQKNSDKKLKIATIFSFAANEEQNAIGEIQDESFEITAMESSAKEFLQKAINDYNAMFKSNFNVDSEGFQTYYRDLANKVKNQEVDLLIVVGMFLTGFDAPILNTLFVDKNLRYHGLLQSYSRTNRIFNRTKSFGNIVTFRNLERATIDAITLFGDKNTRNVVLEKSYEEYMKGYKELNQPKRGFIEVAHELEIKFPDPDSIERESDKLEFVKLFGEFLKLENILLNYDEFTALKALQGLDLNDPVAVEKFKAEYYLVDEDLEEMKNIDIPSDRKVQDYRSCYNEIREWYRRQQDDKEQEETSINWDDVEFEIDLLKSQEINLDYILELIVDNKNKNLSKTDIVEEVRRAIRASLGHRAKESLIVEFINQSNLDQFNDKTSIISAFYKFARVEQKREAEELISTENLNEEPAKRYIRSSLRREYASDLGNELDEILPESDPLEDDSIAEKDAILEKIQQFVDKFKGIGGKI